MDVESNCLVMVSTINKEVEYSNMAGLLFTDCKTLLDSIPHSSTLCFTQREANEVVHTLAHVALARNTSREWNSFPRF